MCAEFAHRYENVFHFRHEKNIGVMENYRFLVASCNTPYFMWRADDDLSDTNFTFSLIELLENNKNASLAFGNIKTHHSQDNIINSPFKNSLSNNSNSINIISNMHYYHASSYYGIWRKHYLDSIVEHIWSIFPDAYAHDHLTILKALVDDKVVGTSDTTFIQRTFSEPKGDGLRGQISLKNRIERFEELLPKFTKAYDRIIQMSGLSEEGKKHVTRQRKQYTKLRLRASKPRIIRLKLKLFFGNIWKPVLRKREI